MSQGLPWWFNWKKSKKPVSGVIRLGSIRIEQKLGSVIRLRSYRAVAMKSTAGQGVRVVV